jgi:transposase
MALEIAWCWVRYQPNSELTLWFLKRFGVGQRLRKIGIVAVARKLLVALWKYLEHGEIPKGAELVDDWKKKVPRPREAGVAAKRVRSAG